MSKWELYLTKNTGDVVVGVFPNKKEAKEESKYRQDLPRGIENAILKLHHKTPKDRFKTD